MAKLGRWPTFQAMSKNLSLVLKHLTIADNVDSSEFRWQTWSPDVTTSGAMTVSRKNAIFARYVKFGSTVIASLGLDVTTAGTPDTAIIVTLPVRSTDQHQVGASYRFTGGANEIGHDDCIGPVVKFYRPGVAAWANGTHYIYSTITYESA